MAALPEDGRYPSPAQASEEGPAEREKWKSLGREPVMDGGRVGRN